MVDEQVWEETGFDASEKANENDALSLYLNEHQSTLYIVTDVDEDFPFEPQVNLQPSMSMAVLNGTLVCSQVPRLGLVSRRIGRAFCESTTAMASACPCCGPWAGQPIKGAILSRTRGGRSGGDIKASRHPAGS